MRIEAVEAKLYRLPLWRTLTDSRHGEMTEFEVVLVRVRTEDDIDGVGYTYTIGEGGQAICSLIDTVVAPTIVGMDANRIESIWETLWWKLHYVGRGGLVSFAISATDIALWDALGKRFETPLWRLLGGHSQEVIPYAGGIDLMFSIDELLRQADDNLEAGFPAIKMKVGRPDYRQDIVRVRTVRQHIGPDVVLMVDANMMWTAETAVRAARAMAPFDVYWLEEPTIPDDYEAHSRIEHEGGIPVASGENLHTINEFKHMIDIGGVSFPEPDVSNCGGVTGWMRVARLAYANNRRVTTHGVHELHLHLLAAIPNASYLEVHGFGLEKYMHNPPEIVGGVMRPPDESGHGVEFDWDALSKYEVASRVSHATAR